MAANGEDRQAAMMAAAPEEEEIVVEMPVKPAPGASAWETAALPLSMVVVQAFTVVMLLLSKLALNTGMRPCVLIVYRNLVATAAVAPLALIFERYGYVVRINFQLFFLVAINREYIPANNLFCHAS